MLKFARRPNRSSSADNRGGGGPPATKGGPDPTGTGTGMRPPLSGSAVGFSPALKEELEQAIIGRRRKARAASLERQPDDDDAGIDDDNDVNDDDDDGRGTPLEAPLQVRKRVPGPGAATPPARRAPPPRAVSPVASTELEATVQDRPENYEAVYSGTLCRFPGSEQADPSESAAAIPVLHSPRPPPPPPPPSSRGPPPPRPSSSSGKKSVGQMLRSVLKKTAGQQQQQHPVPPPPSGYDFHRAVEKLVVEKMDLQHHQQPHQLLDTSSESGYGSDQDSLASNRSSSSSSTSDDSAARVQQTIGSVGDFRTRPSLVGLPPSLPPRLSSSSGTSPSGTTTTTTTTWKTATAAASSPRGPPPPRPTPGPRGSSGIKRRVRFDAYVLFLQGLKERDEDLVGRHVPDVCEAAFATDEVVAEVVGCIVEGREAVLRHLLSNGFRPDAVVDAGAGMTPLHVAAAFNHLPIVRALLSHGAAVYARAHSSGRAASELCSRQLPGFQACHAYLRCMEECLGVANSGRVFSAYSYRTTGPDELSLAAGDELRVVRKGDYPGSSWWWCQSLNPQHDQRQGYVLKDFLALNRSHSKAPSSSSSPTSS